MKFQDKIDELSKIELTVSHIYSYFSIKFSNSSEFWLQLSDEEKEHAFFFSSMNSIDDETKAEFEKLLEEYAPVTESLRNRLNFIDKYIHENDILEEEAFGIAFQIEYSVNEVAFQSLIKGSTNTSLVKNLKIIYGEAVDHLDKLHDYTHEHRILVQQPTI